MKDIYSSVKHTPLKQANSNAQTESNTLANSKLGGVVLTRSASMLSQTSHISDTSGTKPRNPVKNFVGRDWLGRSKSQQRLPFHSQDSFVSIKSERSSTEERTKSPPPSGHAKVSSFHNLS